MKQQSLMISFNQMWVVEASEPTVIQLENNRFF